MCRADSVPRQSRALIEFDEIKRRIARALRGPNWLTRAYCVLMPPRVVADVTVIVEGRLSMPVGEFNRANVAALLRDLADSIDV